MIDSYLHGEDMFLRLQVLSLFLLGGFNLVASSSPSALSGELKCTARLHMEFVMKAEQ